MTDLPAKVCLDSAALRRIREEKKLTQLYVSKVVGVTTDTISRWENNRYPTVKRENALRLAEALDVEVAVIIEREGDLGAAPDLPGPRPRRRFGLALVAAVLAILGALWLWRWSAPPASLPALVAERRLPPFAAPGSVIPIYLQLENAGGLKGFILREHLPPGWTLVEAEPSPSSSDREQGTLRWIVKPGEGRQVIRYLARVPDTAPPSGAAEVAGEVIYGVADRSLPAPVQGDSRMTVAPRHWADRNGDGRIDDGEMLLASDLFDLMQGVSLDWAALEQLWDSGRYQWDAERRRFLPVKAAPSGEGQP